MKTIDITPTWGEWANLYRRLAESGEANAIRELRQDFARASPLPRRCKPSSPNCPTT